MPLLLIVDDEPSIHHAFHRAFRGQPFEIITAGTISEAESIIRSVTPDAIVLDLHLPDATGLEGFRRLQTVDQRTPTILITGHGTTDLAIQAMKLGAFEYLLKPLEPLQIRELITQAVHTSELMRQPAMFSGESDADGLTDVLIGQCPMMQDLYKGIGRVAAQEVTVLLLGESGTGKELVARAIYQHSRRADKPFLAINCAAIPETLLESELFGHEKGAFTGADRRRIGKFEQCHGGTLFLDEVAELSPPTQARFLRLIQEQRFERLGSNETIQTDVRLIAATNANLEAMSRSGKYRSDLYFRLNVYSLRLPPLRDRGSDLDLLIEHFVRRFSADLGKSTHSVTTDALRILKTYRWPGNVRELQSVLKQALLQMQGAILEAHHLPARLRLGEKELASREPEVSETLAQFIERTIQSGADNLYALTLEYMERELISRVLKHTGGNQVHAARLLGIARGSLRTRLRSLSIEPGTLSMGDHPGDGLMDASG